MRKMRFSTFVINSFIAIIIVVVIITATISTYFLVIFALKISTLAKSEAVDIFQIHTEKKLIAFSSCFCLIAKHFNWIQALIRIVAPIELVVNCEVNGFIENWTESDRLCGVANIAQ